MRPHVVLVVTESPTMLDLHTQGGGLSIQRRTGGHTTINLHLKNPPITQFQYFRSGSIALVTRVFYLVSWTRGRKRERDRGKQREKEGKGEKGRKRQSERGRKREREKERKRE